jgi:flagellar biosynthesis GTPase FlhF
MEPVIEKNFDLEQGILRCWNMVEDLDDVIEMVRTDYTNQAVVISALEAVKNMAQLRFDRTWATYEEVCHGLHELKRQRDALQQTALDTQFDEVVETVAEKPQAKMAKSKQAKAVDK